MIRYADKNDINEIRYLWDMAFPEEPKFNDYFFDNIFDCKNTLLLIKDNIIASMVQMIPYELRGVGTVTYIYGAATHSLYRKQGLMSRLLKRSFEIDVKKGIKASILIPANKPLFEFYKRLGYETAFYVKKEEYTMKNKYCEIRKADYNDIPLLMSIYNGDIIRDEEYWKKQLDMYKALGGRVLVYGAAYAVVSDNVDEIMYKNEQDRSLLLNNVCRYLNKKTVAITESGGAVPFGMIKWHIENRGKSMYMNMMYN